MANGNGSLARAWEKVDTETKLGLAVNELDRVYARLDAHATESTADHATLRREFLEAVTAIKADFNERISTFRAEVHEGFKEMEKRDNRKTALFYTLIGSLIAVLIAVVVNLASGQ